MVSAMDLYPTCLSWSSSISSTAPINCSTEFLNENHCSTSKPAPSFRIQSLKRSSKPGTEGLQKDPKKDLSRVLRTEAAIKGVENKGKSWKHRQLWPKAVLEALDEAIKGRQWQTALKVGPNFKFCFFFFVKFSFFFSATFYSVECFPWLGFVAFTSFRCFR